MNQYLIALLPGDVGAEDPDVVVVVVAVVVTVVVRVVDVVLVQGKH